MFTKKILRFLLAFWLLPLALGCQPDKKDKESPKPEKWEFSTKRHYIRYVASKRELQTEVSFETERKDARLPSKYWLGEQVMQVKSLPNSAPQFRLLQEPVNFSPPYILRHLDTDGQKQLFDTLDLPQLANLRIGSQNLSLSKGGALAWEGGIALGAADELRILITDSDGKTTSIIHIGDTPKGMLPLPLEQIAALPKGAATVSISLSRADIKPQTKTARRIEYYFEDISTSIVP